MRRPLIIDLFAGGGGASTGIERALGRPVDIGINHDPVALAVHKRNHPLTRHLEADIWDIKPLEATGGAPVGLLWASPDCTHFSVAKGARPRRQKIRSLAWAVVRWAAAVQPAVICLENVAEFRGWGPLDEDGRPRRREGGLTFLRWRRRLERLGYVVQDRVLDASRYGAPTRRRRLFVVARRDGLPISWPDPTHGPGLLPLRTAAECIDWSLPCPSIFERERPLADKTLWRIAQGLRRFVLDTGDPFIVHVNHGKQEARVDAMGAPLSTVTASRRGHAVVSPTLIQIGYGERDGQAARVPGLDTPLGTVVAGGRKHALVSAFLAKHFGGVVGTGMGEPVGTVTSRDHHSLTAATLIQFNHANKPLDLRAPLSTVTSNNHVAEVRAFLTAFYGSDGGVGKGQSLNDPMRTLRAKHCLGLVTVAGTEYQIADIGMRMLEPHELLRAQFGQYAAGYDLEPARTKSGKVRLIGNSVCPEVAEALVRAQFTSPAEEAVA